VLKVDEETQDRQLSRLADVKAERDDEAVEETLDDLREAIEAGENVMPYIVDAVKAYATMGEIMDVFERKHGSYRETIGLA
jgi:methylmalonyl-CoA mutase N-terminal domain/subunit